MARIGYAKIGRSYNLDIRKAGSVGGDADVLNTLRRLALKHPEHEFVLIGKNSGENPQEMGFPANITNPWTKWKENFTSVPDPVKADQFIEGMRELTGDAHLNLDAMIVWAGQHGSANSRIPMIGSDWDEPPGTEFKAGKSPEDLGTNEHNDLITGGTARALATPQFSFVHYVSWLLDFISRWREAGPGPTRREEIWLCPDPRNYLKCREMRWPLKYPILAQYDFLRYHKSERYGRFPDSLKEIEPNGYRENSLWVSNLPYCYSGLELTAVSGPDDVPFDPRPGQHRFGMVVNENLTGVADSRLQILQDWVFPNFTDASIRGHWTEKSQIAIGKAIDPVPYNEVMGVMKSFATTLTTPASGSGWATAKPWEAFALGSVCFFHPRYDDQFHILPSKDGSVGRYQDSRSRTLADFLRVRDAAELVDKVQRLHDQPELYHTIVTEQRRHYEKAYAIWEGGTLSISDRIDLDLYQDSAGDYINPGAVWTTPAERPAAKLKMEVRKEPRPRGTNEERKHKAPVSRRKRIRPEVFEQAQTDAITARAGVEETTSVDTSKPTEKDTYDIQELAANPTSIFATSVISFAEKTDPATRQILNVPTYWTPALGGLSVKPKEEKKARPGKDDYFSQMAKLVATRSTCLRRAVGTVLVNERGHVLATGYNGTPSGFEHCNAGFPCTGATAPSGTNLDGCLAVHSEIAALMQCRDVHEIRSVYVTTAPCVSCVKALLSTGATRIVYAEDYPQAEAAKQLWLTRAGNEWIKL